MILLASPRTLGPPSHPLSHRAAQRAPRCHRAEEPICLLVQRDARRCSEVAPRGARCGSSVAPTRSLSAAPPAAPRGRSTRASASSPAGSLAVAGASIDSSKRSVTPSRPLTAARFYKGTALDDERGKFMPRAEGIEPAEELNLPARASAPRGPAPRVSRGNPHVKALGAARRPSPPTAGAPVPPTTARPATPRPSASRRRAPARAAPRSQSGKPQSTSSPTTAAKP